MNRDWRAYFNIDELDKAYEAVEIENRDIPEEDSADFGSDSNPSDDNLDAEEIFEKVYELPATKAEKQLNDRQLEI